MSRIAGALVLAASLAACEPIDIDGGGGGGGGGNGLFTRGFAFVRDTNPNLYVVDDAGDPNNPRRLTTAGGVSQPGVSSSGRSVVFVHKTATGFELQTVPTDGSAQPSTVFASGTATCQGCTNFSYPTFNPAGNVIVFAFNRGSGNFSLGKVNTDGSGFQVLTNDPGTSFGAPSFFPDGQSVLVPSGTSSSQLSQLQRVGLNGSIAPVANDLGQEARWVVTRAVVSPDGRQVALDGRLFAGGSRIFVGPLSPYSAPSQVTDHSGIDVNAQDTFPSWMGTSQVGFLSDAGGGNSNIYRISLPVTTVGPGTLLIPSASEPSYGGT